MGFNEDIIAEVRADDGKIGGDTIAVTASEVTGAERDRIYTAQASVMPGFADYEKRTTRVIPVVALTRT